MNMVPGNGTSKVEAPSVPLDMTAHQPSDNTATVETSGGDVSKRSRDEEEVVDDHMTEIPPEKRSRTEADESQVELDDSNNDKQPPHAESQVSESARAAVFSPVVTRSRTSEKVQETESIDATASKPLISGSQESQAVKEEEEKEPRIQGRWRGETVDVFYFSCRYGFELNMFYKFTKWLRIMLVSLVR
jgi:hypothetical protein